MSDFIPKLKSGDEAAVLPLTLTRQWYDMIESGGKREEYRVSPRVISQVYKWVGRGALDEKSLVVRFFDGYRSGRRTMEWMCERPFFRSTADHPEHGEPDGRHLVIPLLYKVDVV